MVIVTDYAFVNGGNGQVSLSSAVALAKSGIKTIIFAAAGPIGSELEKVPLLTTICLGQHEFLSDPNVAAGALRGLWNFRAASEFEKILATLDPTSTIVHVHSWTKALSSSVVRVAVTAGFPVVLTIHDYFAFCPNGSLYDHAKEAPCLLTPMSAACVTANCDPRSRVQKLYRVARQLLTDRFAGIPRNLTYFICVSAFSRSIAEQHLGTSRIFDVMNPIDTRPSTLVDPGANDEFVYVGRLSREKGTDLLAVASKSANARAVFIGDGPLAATMRQVAPEAEFTGWLDREGVRDRLSRARALVLPSRWYEASPLVVPEASALGIPSIVAEDCAASRSIVDGVTGFTFKSGSAPDLARVMTLVSNPETASRVGRAAFDAFWSDPPTMNRHVSALREVYETILAPTAC